MKLLVLANTPPPLHGQSLMVQTLVEGMRTRHGISVHHVNLPLSRDTADIGRIRLGKLWSLIAACRRARRLAREHGLDVLYYVPTPGKRSALYRDWIAMGMLRSAFRRIVLHWHAAGLGEWLARHGTALERRLTFRALGLVDLSLVLTPSLRIDAEALGAKRIEVVPNGIADPCPEFERTLRSDGPFRVLFLGLCSDEKGVFDAAKAVITANRMVGTVGPTPPFSLTAAGPFPDLVTQNRFERLLAAHPGEVHHAGVVTAESKDSLYRDANVFCFPTRYPYEGQPLVLLESMAYDLPIIASRWRGLPETLSPNGSVLIDSIGPSTLADALVTARRRPPPIGVQRRHYLAFFTRDKHLDRLVQAFSQVDSEIDTRSSL